MIQINQNQKIQFLILVVLLKKTNYDAKIVDTEGKIPDVSTLAIKTTLTTVENKIPSVSSLAKKTDYNTKATEIDQFQFQLNNHNHDKYISTPEFNTLATDVFNARLSQANLVTKTNFENTVSTLHSKDAKNKTRNKSIENEFKKIKTFDLGYCIARSHFQEEDGVQNYLVFQPIRRYFGKIANAKYLSSWKFKTAK